MMRELPATMMSIQLQEPQKMVLTELPIPKPKSNEVLIKTKAATICTSDLHDIESNPFGIKLPNVLGHEGAGVIVACGGEVKYFLPGMRVAAHPVVPCGVCEECRRGFEHLCLNMGHLGIDRPGTYAEYFIQRSDRIRQIPDDMSFPLGSLLEPVANCLQAVSRSGNIAFKKILIVGDGPFANIIARLAVKAGAGKVMVTGKTPFRLSMIPGVEIVDNVPKHSVDVAILAVSAEEAVKTCLNSLRKRGRMVVFSLLENPVAVDLFNLHISELEITGCCNDEFKIDQSLACLNDPELNFSEIITHQIPFKNWKEAFYLAKERHDIALKVSIVFD
ncbi:MAG: alcohol dehydrogenase catalytic domain-containing protein [Ginsengibacter sp.]